MQPGQLRAMHGAEGQSSGKGTLGGAVGGWMPACSSSTLLSALKHQQGRSRPGQHSRQRFLPHPSSPFLLITVSSCLQGSSRFTAIVQLEESGEL